MSPRPGPAPKSPDEPAKPRRARKPPSEAQLAANRANAQLAKGPTSAAGMARSAQNSLKNGLYATKVAPILAGAFAEDAEEVGAYVQSIIDALDPSDVLEERLASEIALIALKERRLVPWEDTLLAEAAHIGPFREGLARDRTSEFLHNSLVDWNASRAVGGSTAALEAPNDLPWVAMGSFIENSLAWESQTETKGWAGDIEASSDDELRDRFAAFIDHHFHDPEHLARWLDRKGMQMRASSAERQEGHRVRVASESIGVVDRTVALRARLNNEMGKHLALYAVLKSRDLTGDASN